MSVLVRGPRRVDDGWEPCRCTLKVRLSMRARPIRRRRITGPIPITAIRMDGAIAAGVGAGAAGDDQRDRNAVAARARCSMACQLPALMSDAGAIQEPPTATTFG